MLDYDQGKCKWVSTIQSVSSIAVLSTEAHSNSLQSQRRLRPLSGSLASQG